MSADLRIGRRLHEILPFRWIELLFYLYLFIYFILLQCDDRPCVLNEEMLVAVQKFKAMHVYFLQGKLIVAH